MKKIKQFKRSPCSAKSFKSVKESGRSERTKLYDSEWTKYRYRFLHYNPKCYCCSMPAKDVDHVVAHKGDIDLFWNTTNHIPLCKACHSTVTAMFDRHCPPKTQDKMKWIKRQRDDFKCKVAVKIIPRGV